MFLRSMTLVLLSLTPLFGQADAIAVVAGRTVDLAPGEVTFMFGVIASSDISLDQVLEATKSLELTSRHLMGVSSQQFGPGPDQVRLVYQFSLTTEFSRFRETNDKLAALRRSLVVSTPAMELQTLSIAISPTEASREQARQRLVPQLIADARQRGEELAQAAGLSLGRILGLSEASTAPIGYIGPYGPSSLRTTFSLSVRFAVQ